MDIDAYDHIQARLDAARQIAAVLAAATSDCGVYLPEGAASGTANVIGALVEDAQQERGGVA